MRFFFNRSAGLGRNLSLAVGLSILISAAAISGYSVFASYSAQISQHRKDSLLKSQLFSATLGGAVRFGKVDILTSALERFGDEQPNLVAGTAVFDLDGVPIVSVGETTDASATITEALQNDASVLRDQYSVTPIGFGPENATTGYLVVSWSLDVLHATIRQWTLILVLVAIGLSALAWFAAYFLIGRIVTRPINSLAGSLGQITVGELNLDVPMTDRQDEIGALAKDIASLQQQLVDNEQERSQQQAREQAAKAEKSRMLSELDSGVGEIVSAAQSGVFDRSVDVSFDDPTLQSLGDGINALCATIADFLDELGKSADGMSNGDFNQTIPNRFDGRLGIVAKKLNSTAAIISEMIQKIAETEASITASVCAMKSDASDLSRRAEVQAASLQQTSSSMEEMTATTQLASQNVVAAAERANEARQSAREGTDIVRDAIDAMTEIRTESGRISDIISVIEGIAFQTNLLALNAAVEAARAGDAGKGFAVVASEVRTLAQRAADAAGDITQLITTSQKKVANGSDLVDKSGDVLEAISSSIPEVSDRLSEISEMEELIAGIKSISEEIAQLDEVTQHSAQIAQRSASSADDLERYAQTLAGLMDYLSLHAHEEFDVEPDRKTA